MTKMAFEELTDHSMKYDEESMREKEVAPSPMALWFKEQHPATYAAMLEEMSQERVNMKIGGEHLTEREVQEMTSHQPSEA